MMNREGPENDRLCTPWTGSTPLTRRARCSVPCVGPRVERWPHDVQQDTWSPLRSLPPRLAAPFAFGSEVYALAGRPAAVLGVQLGRWTRLPADPRRPALIPRTVTASRSGTVV